MDIRVVDLSMLWPATFAVQNFEPYLLLQVRQALPHIELVVEVLVEAEARIARVVAGVDARTQLVCKREREGRDVT